MLFITKRCSCEVKQTHHLLMAYAKSTIQFGEKVAHLDTFGVTKRKKEDHTAGDSPRKCSLRFLIMLKALCEELRIIHRGKCSSDDFNTSQIRSSGARYQIPE